jgi:type I restriction enzyme S subunit
MLFRELVACPPILEQQAIAEALSDADALIESLERLIAKKRNLKQGAMQELLTGRMRLPGFEVKTGYKQSDVGMIPEDWEVKSVGTMGDVRAGKALAARGPGQQRPYLRTKNVFDGRIDLDDVLQMPMTDADFSRYCLRYGDVLLNEGQSLELVGRCAMYQDEYPEPCAIQNQLVRFRAGDGVSAEFCAHLFRHCQKSGVFARIAMQTTSVAHLGVSRFAELQLAWPREAAEQEAIAAVLTDMDAGIAALEAKLAKARNIKQGMMQELLTGRIRLI